MSEQTIILKNLLSEDLIIEDLGYKLLSDETTNITNQFSYEDLCNSTDIKTLISDGTSLIINDGINDLSIDEALNYLKRINIYYTLNNFYTKSQLSNNTTGVYINYDNIINSPIYKPVKYRLLSTGITPPTPLTINDVYANTSDNKYYKYYNSQQNYIEDITLNDRVIIRQYSNEEIFSQQGTYFSSIETPSKNDYVIVEDSGNVTPAMYIYDTTSQSLFTSVDLASHLDGVGQKHKADEIGIVTELTNLGYTTGTDLDTILSAIDTDLGLIDSNLLSLNSDITTISGNLDAEIINRSNADSTLQTQIDSITGNYLISNGILYVKNTTKGKQLANNIPLLYSKDGSTKNTYLYIGNIPSSMNGYKLNNPYTLTGISFSNTNVVADSTIIISKNDNDETITSIDLTNSRFVTDNTLNVDIDTNDYIKVYIEYGSLLEASDPIVILYFSQYGGTI